MSIVYLRFPICGHICSVDLWQRDPENARTVNWIMSQGECNDCAARNFPTPRRRYCIGEGEPIKDSEEAIRLSLYGYPVYCCLEHRYLFPGLSVLSMPIQS